MINLFEYQNKIEFDSSFPELEDFLDSIWKKREKVDFYSDVESNRIEVQQFIQFLHKTKEIKSNKYVGVIHFNGQTINLLPKIFFSPEKNYTDNDIRSIQNHILWWLSYCRKIRFPSYQTSLGDIRNNFFEILIYLFAKYTRELLTYSVYQQYEETEHELSFIRGRLNTCKYINDNIVKGRWHKLNCIYDSFNLDNKFNRIVKYVSTLLFNATQTELNKKNLREILFILDEVSDEKAKAEDCTTLKFNQAFSKFETVRDYCYLFLNNCISVEYKNNLKLFAFLLPMEYVFEDFIFGFIDREIREVKTQSQSLNFLDQGEKFTLKPDLLIHTGSRKIIADTKYKMIYSDDKDPKNGISQSDLYQMIAYGIRFNVNEIRLFYPDTINGYEENQNEIIIRDELANGIEINIKCFQLPIINHNLFSGDYSGETELSKLFQLASEKLKVRLSKILQHDNTQSN